MLRFCAGCGKSSVLLQFTEDAYMMRVEGILVHQYYGKVNTAGNYYGARELKNCGTIHWIFSCPKLILAARKSQRTRIYEMLQEIIQKRIETKCKL